MALTPLSEEFEEAEVIFSENNNNAELDCRNQQLNKKKALNNSKKMKKAVPMRIPDHRRYSNVLDLLDDVDDDDENYYKDEGKIVPPHLIVRRRVEGKMAFSVCTGNGRTLKGRDLSQVRNSILRMTGFLEA